MPNMHCKDMQCCFLSTKPWCKSREWQMANSRRDDHQFLSLPCPLWVRGTRWKQLTFQTKLHASASWVSVALTKCLIHAIFSFAIELVKFGTKLIEKPDLLESKYLSKACVPTSSFPLACYSMSNLVSCHCKGGANKIDLGEHGSET